MIKLIKRAIHRIRGLELSAEQARTFLRDCGVTIESLNLPFISQDSVERSYHHQRFRDLRVVSVPCDSGRRVRVTGGFYTTPKDTFSTLRPSSSHRAPETAYFPVDVELSLSS